jgi:hypothetical protein
VQFSIIESKNFKWDGHCINLTSICGNLYNSQSAIGSIYPHLHAYQKLLKTNRELPALRIFSWGPNDIFNVDGRQYLPNFKEAGTITCNVLRTLRQSYKGSIHCHAHSLGATYLLEGLTRFGKLPAEDIPPVMCVDRGFTNLSAASWNVSLLAYASYPIASRLGFQSDAADALKSFFSAAKKGKPLPKITLISAIEDHRMHDTANYCNSVALQTLASNNQICLLGVRPSHQEMTHESAAHSFPVHKIQEEHCVIKKGPACFKKAESFADAFLRQMLEERSDRKETSKITKSTSSTTLSDPNG